ncbi:hypothetical protein MRB53_037601 [Persea americana]|nr:hypothetical protein MRB53_037601 [Persea americana]
MLQHLTLLAARADAVIFASSAALEREVLQACNKYNKCFTAGIQMAPRAWASARRLLTRASSFHFPRLQISKIQILAEKLSKAGMPFILNLGGMGHAAAVPQSLKDLIKESEVGLVWESWADQQAILQHPSISCFLTHGGMNSFGEAMAQGVPLIIWPVAQSDQALNAALASTRDEPVGIELMQIRSGSAIAPAARGGPAVIGDDESFAKEFESVIDQMQGVKGQQLRVNARKLQQELRDEDETSVQAFIDQLSQR